MLTDAARRLAELFDPSVWAAWFASLDRGFAFLLILPFVVAMVGLWSSFRDRDERDGDEDQR
jgi:hypothetical protein